jgi:hypothetical protein
MSVKTNRKPASTPTDEPQLTAVDPTAGEDNSESQNQETTPTSARRRGRSGPKGPALNFNKPRQVALGLLMRRIANGKIPGPLTTPVVSAYITGAKPLPEGHDDLAEHLASFKGVEDLVTGAKLTAARNKVHDILMQAGKTGLPEFERTRTMVDPDAFDGLE